MSAMSAVSFASALHNKFATARATAHATVTQAEWSRFIFPLLGEIASTHGLWWAGRTGGTRPLETVGQQREFLWDFSMYDNEVAGTWNLPQVIVEHENVRSLDAFRFDHWKTLCALAPLRIAIGYCPDVTAQDGWVGAINQASEHPANGWHPPAHVEDLIVLGHARMTEADGNYRFWRRRGTERIWTPIDLRGD